MSYNHFSIAASFNFSLRPTKMALVYLVSDWGVMSDGLVCRLICEEKETIYMKKSSSASSDLRRIWLIS